MDLPEEKILSVAREDLQEEEIRAGVTKEGRWLPEAEHRQIWGQGTYRSPVYYGNVPVPGTATVTVSDTQLARLLRPTQPPARPRSPRPAVKDADGLDLRPDPRHARTAAELVAALQDFHEWAGEPSFRTMAEQCGQMVSASTLHRTLNSRALPPYKAVMAMITGCGGGEQDKSRFASAWRRIRAANRRAAASSPPATMLRAVRDTG